MKGNNSMTKETLKILGMKDLNLFREDEDIPMSVVADEALYAGFKKMGRMN